jgi:WD40 repeat protein
VTSVDISDDSSLLAAGFADSVIRVWSLTPGKLRSMKPPDDLNIIDKEAGGYSLDKVIIRASPLQNEGSRGR